MKIRKIKKYMGMKCAHDKSYRFMVTDDPYPMYNDKFICSLKKKSIYNPALYGDELPCEKCKKFTVSKREISQNYRYLKERKREFKLGDY